MSNNITFNFNTAFSPTDENGKWNQEVHDRLAKALRAKIMLTDGITGMRVDRHTMSVDYLPEIIMHEEVITAVETALSTLIEEVSPEGLFPLRGDKIPTAAPHVRAPREDRARLICSLNSDLMAASTSKEDFENGERELKSWALNKNGARRLDVYLREVRVEFDPRIITAVEMLAHIALVLDHLNSHGTAKFLPFIEPNEPIFVTVSEEPMY